LESSLCHTLDRDDWRAHADSCGGGPSSMWADAVQQRYLINYWPYSNSKTDPQTSDCIKSAIFDSLPNLAAASAVTKIAPLIFALHLIAL